MPMINWQNRGKGRPASLEHNSETFRERKQKSWRVKVMLWDLRHVQNTRKAEERRQNTVQMQSARTEWHQGVTSVVKR
jgi:hypothetical protein